jgi:hypothetical protein
MCIINSLAPAAYHCVGHNTPWPARSTCSCVTKSAESASHIAWLRHAVAPAHTTRAINGKNEIKSEKGKISQA